MEKLFSLRFPSISLEIHSELAKVAERPYINFLSLSYKVSSGRAGGSQTVRKEGGGRLRGTQPVSILRVI